MVPVRWSRIDPVRASYRLRFFVIGPKILGWQRSKILVWAHLIGPKSATHRPGPVLGLFLNSHCLSNSSYFIVLVLTSGITKVRCMLSLKSRGNPKISHRLGSSTGVLFRSEAAQSLQQKPIGWISCLLV